ncbi:class I SAM-dependent methyltransferase [Polaromonas sp.]|uniref:class I SAM-dependent methyltransferase n=1 Tax=Polaromonas sp. TaxID=1869339 RepID=UPI0032656A5E
MTTTSNFPDPSDAPAAGAVFISSAGHTLPAQAAQAPHTSVMKPRTSCPACMSASLTQVYEEPYASEGIQNYLRTHYEGKASHTADDSLYVLTRCDRCGLSFQKYIPDDAFLGEIYNSWVPGSDFEREHRNYSLEEYRYLAEQVQFVIQHLGRPPGELHMLDFGFGWAHWSKMAMGYGCRVSGVELSQERAEHGRSVGIQVVPLDHLPDRAFHFIHTEQVFEHLVEPRAVLDRLAAALAPGGLIKISVPDAVASLEKIKRGQSFGSLSAKDKMPIAPLEHINAFDHASLVAFGKAAGLQPVRPSFFRLYNGASGLLQLKNLARVLARPVYRHVFPRNTFVYFERALVD